MGSIKNLIFDIVRQMVPPR